MRRPKQQIAQDYMDLLWSLWAELGVASVIRRHEDSFVDIEPLVITTALMGDADRRLWDEAVDWTIRYGEFVSKPRLKNLLADNGVSTSPGFLEFAATVNAHAHLRWPDQEARPLQFRPRARALLPDLSRPSLVSLRLRAAFGVGARAELIRVFLARPGTALTAAELAAETGYRKRNVIDSLEMMCSAALVNSFSFGNAMRYQLAREPAVRELVGELPREFPRWGDVLFVLLDLVLAVASLEASSDLERAAAAHRVLGEKQRALAAAGMYAPPLPPGVEAWKVFANWVESQVAYTSRRQA